VAAGKAHGGGLRKAVPVEGRGPSKGARAVVDSHRAYRRFGPLGSTGTSLVEHSKKSEGSLPALSPRGKGDELGCSSEFNRCG